MRSRLSTLFLFAALGATSALGVLAQGCAAPPADHASAGEDEITTDLLSSKKELFDQEMLFVRITNWAGSPDDLRNLRDDARLGDAEVAIYKTNAQSNEHCPSAGNRLVYQTKAFTLRTSGNFTNGTPKSSYKLSLEDKEDKLFGMKDINLKSMWNDVSQMRESIAWQLFADAGVVASQHTYAKLCVDGVRDGQPFTKYMGLYSVIEQVDKALLTDHFGKKNAGGNLYKAYHSTEVDLGGASLGYRKSGSDDSGKQYKRTDDNDARTYQLKTNNKSNDPPALQTYDDLATLVRVLEGATTPGAAPAKLDTPAYAAAVEEVFNVKQFLRWTALNSLLGSWDNYWATQANYYLYNSGKKDGGEAVMEKPYFSWIPWDYDNSLGIDFTSAGWAKASIVDFPSYDGRTSNMANLPALRNVLSNSTFFRYYLDTIEHLNQTLFTVENVTRMTRALRPRIERAAFLEGELGAPAHTGRQFTNDEVARNGFEQHELRRGDTFILGIEHFVRIRHENVAAQIARLRTERNMPRGSSNATFPAAEEPLPR